MQCSPHACSTPTPSFAEERRSVWASSRSCWAPPTLAPSSRSRRCSTPHVLHARLLPTASPHLPPYCFTLSHHPPPTASNYSYHHASPHASLLPRPHYFSPPLSLLLPFPPLPNASQHPSLYFLTARLSSASHTEAPPTVSYQARTTSHRSPHCCTPPLSLLLRTTPLPSASQ